LDVYVDESGDLGFKSRATKFFVVAFITCDSSHIMRTDMSRLLKKFHNKRLYPYVHNELKFCKMNAYCRSIVLEKISAIDSYKGVIIVDKSLVSSRLRSDPVLLYSYLVVHHVMSALFPLLLVNRKMHLVMDKSLSKSRVDAFNDYVRNKTSYIAHSNNASLPYDCVTADHIDSVNEPCLQAVDAIAGAYFQSYENANSTYEDIIKNNMNYINKLWR
jgi:hypothetical protein